MGAEQTITALASRSFWVVIPTLNEAAGIEKLIREVMLRADGCVVADGGSTDGTRKLARSAGAVVIASRPGRARQMNAGAARALALAPEVKHLLFLHADIRLPDGWSLQVAACDPGRWARFDVRLTSKLISGWRRRLLDLISWFMNVRSARTGICTGDQGLLVPVLHWHAVGSNFPDLPLMEDIEMSRLLKRRAGLPVRLPGPLLVSARRWERDGVVTTMCAMWAYRLRWFFGASAQSLHDRYYGR